MTEDQFCAAAVKHIWNTYPATRRLLQHIPNEAKRSKIEWVQLKAKGLIPGASDSNWMRQSSHDSEYLTT